MKKLLVSLLLLVVLVSTLAGCNMQMIDTTYSFERAIIYLPDGDTIEGLVSKWGDYENSDMMQVKIDGKVYLTHSSNVLLISDK